MRTTNEKHLHFLFFRKYSNIMFVIRCHIILCLIVLIDVTSARIIDRCDFVRTLRYKHSLTLSEINVWACIAQYQSGFDTAAIGNDSDGYGHHGLFQISDRYWCSTSKQINACGISCSKLLDDDLTDDFLCIKRIFDEHQSISGNGYNAWTSYKNTCQYVYDGLFTNDCFVGDIDYIPVTLATPAITRISNRIYTRCELARELWYVHQIPSDQIATWVCIAKHESNYNTSAVGYGDHGLFQISDIYWCSPPGRGWVCGLSCAKLEDSDISDDVECMKKIFNEHERLSGDGFNAWSVYRTYCKGCSEQYIDGCFDSSDSNSLVPYDDELHSGATSSHQVKSELIKTKIYERCELARELHEKHKIPMKLVANYVCIAYYESKYNTSALGHLNADGSGDHGIFQISDIYWCSPPGMGRACGLSCDKLEDSDISNDVECMKKIYNEHEGLSGDGFNAWSVYVPYCKGQSDHFIDDCFDEISNSLTVLNHRPAVTSPSVYGKSEAHQSSGGRVFQRCELANELRLKHFIPIDQISTWICIANHASNYNTSAVGRFNADGSENYGIFQISDIYWCSPPGTGCDISCSKLKDSDISDDVDCIRTIYNEHQGLSGDGFNAWTSYKQYCHGSTTNFVEGCFEDEFDRNVIYSVESHAALTVKDYDINSNKSIGKVYERCELAKELKHVHNISIDEIPNWVCIAYHESNYNTAAIGRRNVDGSLDHGLFQISDIYWCSVTGRGKGCSISCSDLENSNITDDVECFKQIYDEHTRISGDGFTAWSVYEPYCKGRASQFTDECFEDYGNSVHSFSRRPAVTSPTVRPNKRITLKSIAQAKIYNRCELALELRDKYNIPQPQIATWVCIAKHSSNFNTSAIGRSNADGSESHGIFQISDIYWCSPHGRGLACGLACSELEDSDISNDVECIKRIYKEYQKLYRDGFNAWASYETQCKDKAQQFIKGCFDQISTSTINQIERTTVKSSQRTIKATENSVLTTSTFFKKLTTPITTTPRYIAASTNLVQSTMATTTKLNDNTKVATTTMSSTLSTSSSSAVTQRSTAISYLAERERVKSLFEIYFNGFQTPRPTTEKFLFPSTQRPISISVYNKPDFVSPVQSNLNLNSAQTRSSSFNATKSSSSEDIIRPANISNKFQNVNAIVETGTFTRKKGTSFIFGVNVPVESTTKTLQNVQPSTTSKIIQSNNALSSRKSYTQNTSTTKFAYLFNNKNSMNSQIPSTDATTINPFIRQYTPATVTSKITYQSSSQRPSSTTLHSFPAYNSNRLTTTTTKSPPIPSINQIISTHDNSISMYNNRFTRAPSTNNVKLTTQYHPTAATQTPFDKIFDLFVH